MPKGGEEGAGYLDVNVGESDDDDDDEFDDL
jgi:hypothetical protein